MSLTMNSETLTKISEAFLTFVINTPKDEIPNQFKTDLFKYLEDIIINPQLKLILEEWCESPNVKIFELVAEYFASYSDPIVSVTVKFQSQAATIPKKVSNNNDKKEKAVITIIRNYRKYREYKKQHNDLADELNLRASRIYNATIITHIIKEYLHYKKTQEDTRQDLYNRINTRLVVKSIDSKIGNVVSDGEDSDWAYLSDISVISSPRSEHNDADWQLLDSEGDEDFVKIKNKEPVKQTKSQIQASVQSKLTQKNLSPAQDWKNFRHLYSVAISPTVSQLVLCRFEIYQFLYRYEFISDDFIGYCEFVLDTSLDLCNNILSIIEKNALNMQGQILNENILSTLDNLSQQGINLIKTTRNELQVQSLKQEEILAPITVDIRNTKSRHQRKEEEKAKKKKNRKKAQIKQERKMMLKPRKIRNIFN